MPDETDETPTAASVADIGRQVMIDRLLAENRRLRQQRDALLRQRGLAPDAFRAPYAANERRTSP